MLQNVTYFKNEVKTYPKKHPKGIVSYIKVNHIVFFDYPYKSIHTGLYTAIKT
jgi:hypothetical protein